MTRKFFFTLLAFFTVFIFYVQSASASEIRSNENLNHRIGYELYLSNGENLKLVTRDSGIASVWVDGVHHSIATFSSDNGGAFQVLENPISEEVLLSIESSYLEKGYPPTKATLTYSPTVVEVSTFDASDINLERQSGPTTIAAVGDGIFRTCGTCGFDTVWVTNACTPCNGGWLCDKIKAPDATDSTD